MRILEEKRCFEMLISVSGVGPKVGISILSESTPEGFALAVVTNDAKALTRANGVGAKLAQRIILELKDKISNHDFIKDNDANGILDAATFAGVDNVNEAISALSVLGYSRFDAASAVKKIDTRDMSVEDIIKGALRNLMR